eukprot:augustus_masked-scaffold_66-processed-gene-0.96-mRNA-1 protein AED:1.00 eAED:1.00 QI:0/0/0/0/1/1/6/0/468
MITRISRIKKLLGNIILPVSFLERQLVHIHLANKHGSLESDLAEAAKFELRTPAAIKRMLRGQTSWKKMVEFIRLFRNNCIHCHRLPKAIKTTYSFVTRARPPRETLVADFLYINRIGHILVLTDAFSRFTQLMYTKTADTQVITEALDKLATNYKLEKDFTLVTDHGIHFANLLMTALRKMIRFPHSFAVSYVSWTKGEVEVANKKVLNFLKSLVSEYRINEDEWPKILNKIQFAINELPVPSRKLLDRKNVPIAYELFFIMSVGIEDDILPKLSVAFRKRLDEYEKNVAKYVEFQKMLNNKRKSTAEVEAPDLPEVKLILAGSPWRDAEADRGRGGKMRIMNFEIKEIRPQKLIMSRVIAGLLYFFKHRDVESSADLEMLRKQEEMFAERPIYGMKKLMLKKRTKLALGDKAVLMEVFAKAGGLQKEWLQIGTQVDPDGTSGSYEVQAVLRQYGVSHLWEEGDISM